MSEPLEPLDSFREIPAAPVEAKGQTDDDKPNDVLTEALSRFSQIVAREEYSRVLSVEDLIFLDDEGGQWQNFSARGFLSGVDMGRSTQGDDIPAPRYQIDRISPVIEQAVSDQREAQININVRAKGNVDKGLIDTLNGMIKNIEQVSDAQDAYDNAYDECQKSGYGGWRITTRLSDNSFNQEAVIEPILNATQSLFFGPAKKSTKEDALYAFLIWDMDRDEFEIQYPDAQITDWKEDTFSGNNRAWFNNQTNMVRIAEYWRKRPVKREIVQLQDLQVIDADQLDAVQTPEGVFPAQSEVANGVIKDGAFIPIAVDPKGQPMRREMDAYEVERFVLNGVEVLKGPQAWPGKYIPLIPEYGVRSVINGREVIRGKVRKGKDPQRIYNYGTSAIIQAAALSPKDFHWMTPAQAEGHLEEIEKMNVDQDPVYFYNPDDDAPGPPQKAQGPQVQVALIEQVNQAREDISASVGAGVGIADGTAADTRSGEAIIQGNVNTEKGNSIYFNGHKRAITYTGVQLVDLLPRIKTQEAQERLIKPDGSEEIVTINQTDSSGAIINDLSQAAFDVSVDVGPAYASQRQQGADQLTRLATENPAFAAHTPDLIAKNLDVPGAKELEQRLRREMVLSGQAEPTDEEREEFQLDLRAQIAQELEPQIREQITQEANIRLIDSQTNQLNAQAGNFQAGAQQKGVESQKTAMDIEKTIEDTMNAKMDGLLKAIEANAQLQTSMIEKIAAGIQPSINEIDNLNSQDDIIEEQQQEISPGPSSALEREFTPNQPI